MDDMVNKVDIKYIIDGLGTCEETLLSGYEKGYSFDFGNAWREEVLIEEIYDDRVVLKFDEHSRFFLPNDDNRIEIKKGEEITPCMPIKPTPRFRLKIVDIRKGEENCYI